MIPNTVHSNESQKFNFALVIPPKPPPLCRVCQMPLGKLQLRCDMKFFFLQRLSSCHPSVRSRWKVRSTWWKVHAVFVLHASLSSLSWCFNAILETSWPPLHPLSPPKTFTLTVASCGKTHTFLTFCQGKKQWKLYLEKLIHGELLVCYSVASQWK